MRNYKPVIVAAGILVFTVCAIAFIQSRYFGTVLSCILSVNLSEPQKPSPPPLLTVGRASALRSLAVNKLLAASDDMDSQFNDMFHFLSLLDDDCASMLIPELEDLHSETYLKIRMESMQEHLKQISTALEGNSEQVPPQVAFYALLARQPWVRQVCEIGFNAGHSALYWLAASNVTRLLSFDLGAHDYTSPMAQYISATFPGRFNIVLGDSTKTVSQFVANMADKPLACDVIVVDGGHDYEVAKADLQSMRAFARSPRHLLIMDDTPCVASYCDGPNRAWRESRQFVKPVFGCTLYPGVFRGFAVGYYVT